MWQVILEFPYRNNSMKIPKSSATSCHRSERDDAYGLVYVASRLRLKISAITGL